MILTCELAIQNAISCPVTHFKYNLHVPAYLHIGQQQLLVFLGLIILKFLNLLKNVCVRVCVFIIRLVRAQEFKKSGSVSTGRF